MVNENPVVVEKHCAALHSFRVCWSAVFAGVFVGLGLGFLLHLYGVAISLSAFSSTPDGASIIAVGGLIGLLIGVIASMGISGFVAGYLGRFHYHPLHGGVLYGFITWSLILVLSAISTGPVGSYVAAYGKALTHPATVQVLTDTASNSTPTVTTKKVVVHRATPVVTPAELAWGGWIVFALFFIGALSSCIGACCGMHCKREHAL